MWRKNIAGRRCLFVGVADASAKKALQKCFGWNEVGHIGNCEDLNIFLEVLSVNGEVVPEIIAVCVLKQTPSSNFPMLEEIEDSPIYTAELAQAVVRELAPCAGNAKANDEVPKVLYFVEDVLHRERLLVAAIQAKALAYFVCGSFAARREEDLVLNLIYSQRGVVLDHQLEISAVLVAQNLTPFQLRIMRCLRDDILTDKEIAQSLNTSESMVSKTIGQLFQIFNCNRRSSLAKQSAHL
ncbi:Uncharacterised protein [Corynebacterium renale]|uniref:helix-turn-helix transcriptional regulator n=1 Tax=Corynebacterium renale TaxID=1724 RepID=UPI000DA28F8E|nr:hypothetical protein [Corynebacterium renale]SQG64321.1 Uncharacterised protein [Corynebacterium renale]STC94922.1 Uncharacterised protein [Corynebacterium renale]